MSLKLSDPQKTLEIIRKYNFDFRKRFGQNFLVDEHVIERILEAADLTQDDCVLEIGPGVGTLTQYLAERAGHVVAVEIDRTLIPILSETLAGYENVTVINQDIMKTDLHQIAQQYNGGQPLKVVANLPYYITTPILMSLFESHMPVRSVTVMVQAEVAARMVSGPGSKEYGALSLACQYYSRPRIAANVPPNCFIPRPEVSSAVVHMDCQDAPTVQVNDEKLLFAIIRASFNQRRKTLVNGLNNDAKLTFSKEEIQNALSQMSLPASVRGEALTLAQFAMLSDLLGEKHSQPGR